MPTRTVVVAFGFDEEVTGSEVGISACGVPTFLLMNLQGAGHLSAALLNAYGENAFAFIIDEGGQLLLV